MGSIALMLAALGVVWREACKPYLRRYTYGWTWHSRPVTTYSVHKGDTEDWQGAAHRARNIRKAYRHRVGEVEVVRSVTRVTMFRDNRVGYVPRMSWLAGHCG